MSSWEDAVASAKERFVEMLQRQGFSYVRGVLIGEVTGDYGSASVKIKFGESFPFKPPRAFPPEDFPSSWHRELDGAMCLYPVEGRESLPWLLEGDFLTMIRRWLTESASGWPGDLPVLDLDRYFLPDLDQQMIVYEDLDLLENQFIQLRRGKYFTRVVGPGSIPQGGAKKISRNRAFGYMASMGELSFPPRDWDEIRQMLPDLDSRKIESGVKGKQFDYLILRYTREGNEAVVALSARATRSGNLVLKSVECASESVGAITLRAGMNARELSNSRVAVIGAGAIGSFLCDQLARAGVGEMTIYDFDIVKPGNLVRHLANDSMVGMAKPGAVSEIISSRKFNSTNIIVKSQSSPGPKEVFEFFAKADLVIDASADGSTTALLAKAAEASGNHLLTVCIQEEGSIVRVDIVPPMRGEPLPPTVLSPQSANDTLFFESGCGEPVSLTPPFAVLEAASLGARFAIGQLLNEPVSDAGIIRDYR